VDDRALCGQRAFCGQSRATADALVGELPLPCHLALSTKPSLPPTPDEVVARTIFSRYLVLRDEFREGVNGPGPGGAWPTQRLYLTHGEAGCDPDRHELIQEGTSLEYAVELYASIFAKAALEVAVKSGAGVARRLTDHPASRRIARIGIAARREATSSVLFVSCVLARVRGRSRVFASVGAGADSCPRVLLLAVDALPRDVQAARAACAFVAHLESWNVRPHANRAGVTEDRGASASAPCHDSKNRQSYQDHQILHEIILGTAAGIAIAAAEGSGSSSWRRAAASLARISHPMLSRQPRSWGASLARGLGVPAHRVILWSGRSWRYL